MAWAESTPLLSLDEYASLMGIDLWNFNQVGEGFPADSASMRDRACTDVWYQHPWQKDFLSREELANTILAAEEALASELGYWPAPHYIANEEVKYPKPRNPRRFGYAGNFRGEWKSVKVDWHKVIGGGIFARTFIGDVALTQTDPDGDTVTERWNAAIAIPTALAFTDPEEVGVYITTADRNGDDISESWRIRPVKVNITSESVIELQGHSSQLIRPDVQLLTNAAPLDVTSSDNYLTQLSVYRIYRDDTATVDDPNQGVAEWDAVPGCTTTPDCTFSIGPVCFGDRQYQEGRPFIALQSPGNWPQNREPDRLLLNYQAGVPWVNGRMNRQVALVVAKLATAMLPVEKCGCQRWDRIIHHWRHLITEDGENTGAGRFGSIPEIDDNPFGEPRLGMLHAWRYVKRHRHVEAVLV